MAAVGLVFGLFLAFIGAIFGAYFHKLGFKLFTKIENVPSFGELYRIQVVGFVASIIISTILSQQPIFGFIASAAAGIYAMVWMTQKSVDADSKEILKSLGIIIAFYVIMGFIVITAAMAVSSAAAQFNQIDLGY